MNHNMAETKKELRERIVALTVQLQQKNIIIKKLQSNLEEQQTICKTAK